MFNLNFQLCQTFNLQVIFYFERTEELVKFPFALLRLSALTTRGRRDAVFLHQRLVFYFETGETAPPCGNKMKHPLLRSYGRGFLFVWVFSLYLSVMETLTEFLSDL